MPGRSEATSVVEPAATGAMSLEEALAVPVEDRRPRVLEEMGAPDTFTIKFEALEGQVVRWEEWSYFDFNARFDFVDGELLWTVDLEPVPEDTLYAHFYDPREFEADMSEAQVRALLADQDLVSLPMNDADVPEGMLLAGDQIVMGFDKDRLVYVETFALTLEEPGEGVAALPEPVGSGEYTPTEEPAPTEMPATATSAPVLPIGPPTNTPAPGQPGPLLNGSLLFADTFDTPGSAAPLFGESAMSFDYVGGRGRLTGYFPGGVLPVMYEEPLVGDFILEVEITTQNLAPGSRVGVIFRSDDIEDTLTYYYHIVLGPAEQVVALDRLSDGAYTLLKAQNVPSNLLPASGTHRLRIEAIGPLLRVFLNGTHVFDYSDTAIPGPGIVGLSIITTSPPEQVQFDNLAIYEAP
jgi:hypothetical protein